MPRAIQRYEVSLKAFIFENGRALFVRESDTGYWELPGGRIDVGEEWAPHAAVLAREMREELGDDLVLDIRPQSASWVRQRPTDGAYLFILARLAVPVSGRIALSAEHDEFGWFDLETARALRFPERSGYVDGIASLFALAHA